MLIYTYICTNRVNTTSMINQSRYNNIEATIIFLATNNNNNDLYTDRISIYPKKNTRQLLKFYIYIIFFSIIRQLYRFESCERNVGHVTCAFDRQPFRYYDKVSRWIVLSFYIIYIYIYKRLRNIEFRKRMNIIENKFREFLSSK